MFTQHFAEWRYIAMHHHAIPAMSFGGIEGKIGFAEECAGLVRPRMNSPTHANTACRLQAGGSGLERGVSKCLANPLGLGLSALGVAPGKHDYEFLAAVSSHRIVIAHRFAHAVGGFA